MLTTTHPIATSSAAETSLDLHVHLRLMQIAKLSIGEIRYVLGKFALEMLHAAREFASYLKTSHSIRAGYVLDEMMWLMQGSPPLMRTGGVAVTLDQMPRFQAFYASCKQHNACLQDSVALYKQNPTKLSLARHCAVTIEHCAGLFLQLSAFIKNTEPVKLTFKAADLFNAEFEEVYTWVVKASIKDSTAVLSNLSLNPELRKAGMTDKISKEGVVFLALSPWDTSIIGIFVLNVDIQAPCRLDVVDGGWVCAYYIEVDSSFEGCGMDQRIIEWIHSTSRASGYDSLSVVPSGNDSQRNAEFWKDMGFRLSIRKHWWSKSTREQWTDL